MCFRYGKSFCFDPLLVGEHDAAEAAALPVDVLGRRIDDGVRAELQRTLEERRGKDVVDDEPRAGLARDLGDRRDVDQLERRVGRAFQEERLRLRPDRLLPRIDVAAVDQRRGDAEPRQQRADHVVAGAEERARGENVVAGLQVAKQRGADGGHAARDRKPRLRAFEQAHALLEHRDGRIGVARIDEARVLALEARLGRLGVGIDEALGQEQRLGGLGELRAHRAAMHQLGRGTVALLLRIVRFRRGLRRHGKPPTKNPAALPLESKTGGFHLRPFSKFF